MARKGAKEKRARNPEALGIAGFTLGIISLVSIIFSTPLFGILLSVIGLIFCLLQQKRQKTRTAKIGIILNSIGLVLNIVWWILLIAFVYPYLQQSLSSLSLTNP